MFFLFLIFLAGIAGIVVVDYFTSFRIGNNLLYSAGLILGIYSLGIFVQIFLNIGLSLLKTCIMIILIYVIIITSIAKKKKFRITFTNDNFDFLNGAMISFLASTLMWLVYFKKFTEVNYSIDQDFIHIITYAASMAHGFNTVDKIYCNYDIENKIQNNNFISSILSIIMYAGATPKAATQILILILLLTFYFSIHAITQILSSSKCMFPISSLAITFLTFRYPIEKLLLNPYICFTAPTVILSAIFLISGIFSMYNPTIEFVFAGILTGFAFSLPEAFFTSLTFSFALFTFTFPFKYINLWMRVSRRIYLYIISLLVVIGVQMFFLPLISNRAPIFGLPEIESLKSALKGFVLSIVLCVVSIPALFRASNSLVILFLSSVSSFLSLLFVSTEKTELYRFFWFFHVASMLFVSAVASNLMTTKRKTVLVLTAFSLLIMVGVIRTAMTSKGGFVDVFGDDNAQLAEWALKNTAPHSIFFRETRDFDPIVTFAGRGTIIGQNELIQDLNGDMPQRQRNLLYLMRAINTNEALRSFGINYVVACKNSTNYAFQTIAETANVTIALETTKHIVYKVNL